MGECCSGKSSAVTQLRLRQSATLRAVLVLNAAMFAVEFVAGLLAGSLALLADSLDMLGDALVYGFSLYVVGRDHRWKARGAMAKAVVMGLFGAFVLGQLLYQLVQPEMPVYTTMGAVGMLALTVNAGCFALLWRHRGEDINMRSVWLCSRNDLVANSGVLLAALGVWAVDSPWPDLAIGALISVLFFRSAIAVMREASEQLRSHHSTARSAN